MVVTKRLPSFDRIAFAYDFLARLVFGNNIKKSQCAFLSYIPPASKVLIIGGGTGWIIEELLKTSDVRELVYIESSHNMLERSKKRIPQHLQSKVTFVLGTQQELNAVHEFDAVLTFFFLDLFPEKDFSSISKPIYNALKKNGSWLICDFDYALTQRWQRALVRFMYLFFKLVSNVPLHPLGNTTALLEEELGMKKKHEKFFFHRMIFSRLYSK